jgi:hypothetical protein
MSHWLVEAVRLRESLWGPLDDDAEVRALRAGGMPLDDAVVQRAAVLAQREGLTDAIRAWRSSANLSGAVLALIAIAVGASTAAAALGDATRPVNLLWAVTGLLGLHLLTFFLWSGGLVWSLATGAGAGGVIGKAWLSLSRRAARGPSAALAPQSLVNLLGRARLLPWLLGAVSHAFWVLALLAALVTMLAMLATRRYDFVWETTILDPGYVERLALWLGSVPGMLGLPTPDAALVRASDGLGAPPGEGRAVWASWLLGVLAVYGVAPRALALALCVWRVRRGARALAIDPSLPGLDTLEARLRPASRRTGVIDPAPDAAIVSQPAVIGEAPGSVSAASLQRHGSSVFPGAEAGSASDWTHADDMPPGGAWRIGIELPEDLRSLPLPAIHDAGVIESGAQRESAIERLHAARPARLLIVCDARQTADRGTVSLVTELARLAAQTRVVLAGSAGASASRRQAWVDRLDSVGLASAIAGSEAEARDWLSGMDDDAKRGAPR